MAKHWNQISKCHDLALGSQLKFEQGKLDTSQEQIKGQKKVGFKHIRGMKRKHSQSFKNKLSLSDLRILKCLKNFGQKCEAKTCPNQGYLYHWKALKT